MFLTSPDLDLQLIIIALVFAAIVALIIGLVKKNLFAGGLWFSIFGNIIFLMNIGSDVFKFYNIEWLLYFSVYLWPVTNVILIVFYIKSKRKNK